MCEIQEDQRGNGFFVFLIVSGSTLETFWKMSQDSFSASELLAMLAIAR